MKPSNTERFFLILSLFTLILATSFYLFFARNHIGSALSQNTRHNLQQNNHLSKAIEALELAEKQVSAKSIDKAQAALDQLKKTDTKLRLQERLNQLKRTLHWETEALKLLEEAKHSPSPEAKEKASQAIEKIKNANQKSQLLKDLNDIVIAEHRSEVNISSTQQTVEIPTSQTIPISPAQAYDIPMPTQDTLPEATTQNSVENSQPEVSDTPVPSSEVSSMPPANPEIGSSPSQ